MEIISQLMPTLDIFLRKGEILSVFDVGRNKDFKAR
jgi:hypothetical protein